MLVRSKTVTVIICVWQLWTGISASVQTTPTFEVVAGSRSPFTRLPAPPQSHLQSLLPPTLQVTLPLL